MNSKLIPWVLAVAVPFVSAFEEPRFSTGRRDDSTEKRVAEIRESEQRLIPLEVSLQAEAEYSRKSPVPVTITITNLFETPLVINRRMLVNHPRLEGEVFFKIQDANGNRVELERPVTPLAVREGDFVVLPKGHSIQRTFHLSDFYGLKKKGQYKIQVCYHNELDEYVDSQKAWKGLVSSEPVEIRIN
jgi:hypothetical protein